VIEVSKGQDNPMQIFVIAIVILFLALFVLMSLPLRGDEHLMRPEHSETQPPRS